MLQVKQAVFTRMGWIFTRPQDLRLVRGIRDLADHRTMVDYAIDEASTLACLFRLRGDVGGHAQHTFPTPITQKQ